MSVTIEGRVCLMMITTMTFRVINISFAFAFIRVKYGCLTATFVSILDNLGDHFMGVSEGKSENSETVLIIHNGNIPSYSCTLNDPRFIKSWPCEIVSKTSLIKIIINRI